jgi:hypothetical protein
MGGNVQNWSDTTSVTILSGMSLSEFLAAGKIATRKRIELKEVEDRIGRQNVQVKLISGFPEAATIPRFIEHKAGQLTDLFEV